MHVAIHRLKRLKEKERAKKLRKKRKTEKVGEDESEDESAADSEEEQSMEPGVAQEEGDVAASSTARVEMERASRAVDLEHSSSNQLIMENASGENEIKSNTTVSKGNLDDVADSDSEEGSEEDGEEGSLWGEILGPKGN